jgi:hypothetical protein
VIADIVVQTVMIDVSSGTLEKELASGEQGLAVISLGLASDLKTSDWPGNVIFSLSF